MNEHPLLLEKAGKWLWARFREYKLPFLSTLLVGLLCYTYAATNKLLNHDEVQSLFLKGGTVTSGRWGLGALDSIFPNYSMPWIYAVAAAVLISCAVCVMIRILSLKNPVLQIILGGCVMAFPSLIGTFSYMFTVSSFALAFFLAVLSVRLLMERGILWKAAALGCMVFSLSIYQSYISVAAGLLVVLLIRRTLCKEDFSALIRSGIGYILFLAASLGLYYAATQVILVLKDVTMNSYAAGNMGFSIAGIPAAIVTAYESFLLFFRESYMGLVPTELSVKLHLLCLVAGVVLTLLHCLKLHSWPHILLLTALIGILPLAINCMYLFTTADSIHTLVLYGFVDLYGLLAVLADMQLAQTDAPHLKKWIGSAAANLISLSLSICVICNIYLANEIWLSMQLRYENAFAFYSSVLAQVQELPEFGPDSRIALIGNYQEPDYYDKEFSVTRKITGTRGFSPDSYSRERFLEYYMGVSLPFVSDDESDALAQSPQVEAMPVYPYYGSIAVIDDVIVIKLS